MITAILVSILLAAKPESVQSWPSFRGDGSSTTQAKNLPLEWAPDKNIAWKTPLSGYGQSSPVVWQDLLFITAIDGDQKEKLIVSAVEIQSGKVAWTKEFQATQTGKNNPMMSRAAPTPVVDKNGVYAFFESGDIVALDHSGDVKWQRCLSKEYGVFKNNHGVGSSPTQTDRAVVILIDDFGPSYLVALDKKTGENVWKSDRKSRSSWTSPVTMTLNDREAIIVSSSGTLDAYDAETGKELASLDGLLGNNIPSPTVSGDLVLVGAGENRMKPDAAASARSNCCVRLTSVEGKLTFERVWEGKKAISEYASPLAYKGHAYFVTKIGLVYCVDLKTGEVRYSERLDSQCWTSPIGAGDHIYFFGKDGITTVIKAGPEFEKVYSNRFWSSEFFAQQKEEAKKKAAATLPKPPEGKGPGGGPPLPKEELDAARYSAVGEVVYGVAVVDGKFFVRTGTELICVAAPSVQK